MKTAYFDTFSGVSGDMCLGALLACGVSVDTLRSELGKLSLPGWSLDAVEVSRNGIGAVDVTVSQIEEQGHGRHLSDIKDILSGSSLSGSVKANTLGVFTRLAEAEAKIHQTTVDQIHFHEVGAIDAIVDITGTCILLELLGIDRVAASPIPMSHGFAECQHGIIPVPAPATLEILRGVKTYGVDLRGEIVTPTGAALLATLAVGFGPMPPMEILSSGYGAGKKEFGNRPNLLRVVIGAETEIEYSGASEVIEMQANLDDMSPQLIPDLLEKLSGAGAIDAFTATVGMKKGRPGFVVTALCPEEAASNVANAMMAHSTSLGVRFHRRSRLCASRNWVPVETPYGQVRIKTGTWNGIEVNHHPEFEDVRSVAEAHGVPIKRVMDAANAAYLGCKS